MILLFLAIIGVIELARALPLFDAFRAMSACSARSMRLMARGGASECSKERAMRLCAACLFGTSLRAGVLLVLVASPLLTFAALGSMQPALLGGAGDWTARLWVAPLGIGYALLRRQMARHVRAR